MESREEQLSQLRDYIKEVDKEITMILQSLQWDRQSLLQADSMVTCKYDKNHRIPERKLQEHEEKCYLKSNGYKPDELLPEPLDLNARTLVKFSSNEIKQIIDRASANDPLFKRGNGRIISEPLTLGQITATYSTDERRAIHDAVVNTMPLFHDLSDLALPSSSCNPVESKQKSRLEVLAELRDVRRRRARYRSSAPTKNYSHTLRELIATQMEMYTGSNTEVEVEQCDQNTKKDTNIQEDTHDKEKYIKRNMREYIKDRNHCERDGRDRHSKKDTRYEKRERERSSHSKDRIYYRHDDSKKRRNYNDSNNYERRSTLKDRRERDNDREKHYRERTEEKYRRSEKNEYRRYYDCDYRSEKLEKRTSKEKSRHRSTYES